MKIVVLTGSPHKDGTSALMAENFMKGTAEAGHEVFRFDTAFKKIHPCIGCDKCQYGKNPCVFQDDMLELYPKLIEADLVAYVTPLYYHNVSAQLKAAVDRYHGINDLIRGTGKKAVLIVTAAFPEEWVFHGITATYETTLKYLGWQDCGKILAYACRLRSDIENTDYPNQAYELGRGL